MKKWPGGLRAQLSDRLASAGVRHEFDSDGDLLYHEDDEELVASLIGDLRTRAGDLGKLRDN